MSRPRFSLLALAVLTIVLSGCGGGERLSKSEYEQHLKDGGAVLVSTSKPLAQAKTGPEFVAGVEKTQAGLRKVADDLDGVRPPEDVEGANGRFVSALRRVADEFEKVKQAAAGGPKDARLAGARLAQSQASADARQAVLEIQRRGYETALVGSG